MANHQYPSCSASHIFVYYLLFMGQQRENSTVIILHLISGTVCMRGKNGNDHVHLLHEKKACKQTIHTLEAPMLPTGPIQQDSVNFFAEKQRVSSVLTTWSSRIKVWKCYQEIYLSNEDFNRHLCAGRLHSSSSTLHLISRIGNNLLACCFGTQGDETGWLLQKMANEN